MTGRQATTDNPLLMLEFGAAGTICMATAVVVVYA